LERYYAILLCRDGFARLVKRLDGETVLAEAAFDWSFGAPIGFSLSVVGPNLLARLDGQTIFEIEDETRPLLEGGIALVLTEGRLDADEVRVTGAL
jgi:hypothetical protein